jgi:hypothetical protein
VHDTAVSSDSEASDTADGLDFWPRAPVIAVILGYITLVITSIVGYCTGRKPTDTKHTHKNY